MATDSPATTFLLVRHAIVDAVGKSIAGWTPGIHLSSEGHAQARQLADGLSGCTAGAIYSSPLERAKETAEYISARLALPVQILDTIGEIHYGDWTGRKLAELADDENWQAYNSFRSGVRIPDGELMLEAQARVVGQLEHLREQHPGELIILVSHGDVIRAALAHFAGIPLDLHHRIEVSPASLSVIVLGHDFARIQCMNMTADYLAFRASPRS
jgi:probable phosphoglycerate mutase